MDSAKQLSKNKTVWQTDIKPKEKTTIGQRGSAQLAAMKNVGSIMAEADMRILQKGIDRLKGNATYKKIDSLLSGSDMGNKPLTRILSTISAGNYDVLKAMIPDMIRSYSTSEYRDDKPILYAIADLIFPTLLDMFDIGINSGLSDEGEINLQNGEFGHDQNGHFGNIAGGIIETLTGIVNAGELVTLVRKADVSEPSKKKKIARFYEKIEEDGDDSFNDAEDFDQTDSDVTDVVGAYMSWTHEAADHNAKHYTDMLSGAKATAKSAGTKYYQKSVTKLGHGYVGLGFGVYDAMERIGKNRSGGDWRDELRAVLDPRAISNRAITGKNTSGIDSEEKFATVSGGIWTNTQERIKGAMNNGID